MSQFLFIGLGNPGDQYHNTRHNAGWLALDELVALWSDPSLRPRWQMEKRIRSEVLKLRHGQHELIFLKPQTFMNDSGEAAAGAAKWYLHADPAAANNQDFPNIIVFHDDLDIELGRYKLQFGSGPKVHNGVNSVRDHLHSPQFWSARIGVDDRQGNRDIPGQAYVLQRMGGEQKSTLQQAIRTLAEELPYLVLQ